MSSIDIPVSGDTSLLSSDATTNWSTSTILYIGEHNAAAQAGRAIIKPDFSTLPVGCVFDGAILKLTPTVDYSDNVRIMRAHRCLRDVVITETTWNIWKTSNNWGTAGCSNSTTDYDGAVEMGNMEVPASPTLNTPLSMTLNAAELQKLYDGTYTNNGIVLFMDTQVSDQIRYASLEHATPAYRPVITIYYNMKGNFFAFFF